MRLNRPKALPVVGRASDADLRRFAALCQRRLDGCWEWTGYQQRGYGRFKFAGRVVWAHRFAAAVAAGGLRQGVDVHHECRNPSCVNPEHLRPVGELAHRRQHAPEGGKAAAA